MNRFYDNKNHRLVFIGQASTSTFWDQHWKTKNFEEYLKGTKSHFVVGNTRRYLPKGSKILEGGCGRGATVYGLKTNGYDAYGIDYAKETVEKINRYAPELKISLGDVRKVEFEDGYFDGYWSLGVIEHFYEGYDQVLHGVHRVLKRGGYLFLTVPAMSLLRRFKAKFGMYPEYIEMTVK